MDFAKYLPAKTTKSGNGVKKHYIGPIVDEKDWDIITKCFGTSSPRELSLVILGLSKDLKAGNVVLTAKVANVANVATP